MQSETPQLTEAEMVIMLGLINRAQDHGQLDIVRDNSDAASGINLFSYTQGWADEGPSGEPREDSRPWAWIFLTTPERARFNLEVRNAETDEEKVALYRRGPIADAEPARAQRRSQSV